MAKFVNLSELDLGVPDDRIARAMKPFVATGADYGSERWDAEIALRRKRLSKRLRNRLLGSLIGRRNRDTQKVRDEYDAVWAEGYERYRAKRDDARYSPWLWRDKQILFDAAGAPRFRSLLYGAVIDALKPKRVLEVGSGDGINLLLLAGVFPKISFTGLELTDSGHHTAMAAKSADALPPALEGYSVLPQKDPLAFQRIDFVQGNACRMPFEDNAFDLVMTILSVEQMERVRHQALTEIVRVTRNHVLNLEPFQDINANGVRRLNVRSRDYFRGKVDELVQYGLAPVWATGDFPQEVFLGAALVLSRKT